MQEKKENILAAIDDCWNRAGVWGTKDCSELGRVLICNNCEVYSRAGRRLLDRTPPEGYGREWTDLLARDESTSERGDQSAFVFRVGTEWFALPSWMLVEVLEPRPVHSVPHRIGRVFKGLVNVRGELQLCVSVAAILEVDVDTGPDETEDNTKMLFLQKGGEHIVFPVDEVHGIHHYRGAEVGEVPSTLAKASANYVRGLLEWDKGHVSILDEGLLFKRIGRSLL